MILFLDIDGVMNIINYVYSTQDSNLSRIERHHIALLDGILDKHPETDIVFTTSRRDNMDKLLADMVSNQFQGRDAIVGMTEINSKKRGQQILDYIAANDVTDYLVIDDEISGICGIDGKFISEEFVYKIDPNVGMTIYDYDKICNIIKKCA